jgi:hypothetical protein
MPGVPAAGHITASGYWHPGDGRTCHKCDPRTLCRYSGALAVVYEKGVRQRWELNSEHECIECGERVRVDGRGRLPRHYRRNLNR